jgi:hypothetical protein
LAKAQAVLASSCDLKAPRPRRTASRSAAAKSAGAARPAVAKAQRRLDSSCAGAGAVQRRGWLVVVLLLLSSVSLL